LCSMVDLARQQHEALLGALALGDVYRHPIHAHRPAPRIARDDAGAIAPTHFAAWADDAKLGPETLLRGGENRAQRALVTIVGVHHRVDTLDGRFERRGMDAEDPVGAIVPFDKAARHIDLPGAHVAGRERDRAPLLAAAKTLGLGLELGSAGGDPCLELG